MVQGDLINDPAHNLHGEMDALSKEDLKERLIVAEKVMKSLFQRNKDLEEKFQNEAKTTAATSHFDQERCSACPSVQAQNETLNQRIEELEKEMVKLRQGKAEEGLSGDPSYKALMEVRLQETMAEAKRHHQSYLDMRQ